MALAGWIMTGFLALFMVGASSLPKFLAAEAAVNSMTELGWSPNYLLILGLIEVGFTLLFVIPRTSLIGAILLTALFGGAMASHLRDEGLRAYLFALIQGKA